MNIHETSDAVHADDLQVGQAYDLGTYVVTQAEVVAFAQQWDPQFFHTDAERAVSEGHFGGLVASGVQTLAIYQRLWVLSRTRTWQVIAGAGITDLRFRRPVRPGDTLRGFCTIGEVRFERDKKRGLVDFHGQLVNQQGDVALSLTTAVYLMARPA